MCGEMSACESGVFIGLLSFCPVRLLQPNVCRFLNPNTKGRVANFFSLATFCICESDESSYKQSITKI